MAAGQRAPTPAYERMEAFAARRRKEEVAREAAYALGQQTWAASTRSGANHQARTPAEVLALGQEHIRYGSLKAPAPTPDELAELRRQQAAQHHTVDGVSHDNRWMAIPALAPAAVVAGLEGLALLAGRAATSVPKLQPVILTQRYPYQRGGETPWTRAGRDAHKAFSAKVNAKPGWDANKVAKGTNLRPDAVGPPRGPVEASKRFQLELKPDTPRGRLQGPKAAQKYRSETGNPTRPIYYDPTDFM